MFETFLPAETKNGAEIIQIKCKTCGGILGTATKKNFDQAFNTHQLSRLVRKSPLYKNHHKTTGHQPKLY